MYAHFRRSASACSRNYLIFLASFYQQAVVAAICSSQNFLGRRFFVRSTHKFKKFCKIFDERNTLFTNFLCNTLAASFSLSLSLDNAYSVVEISKNAAVSSKVIRIAFCEYKL